MVHCEGFVLYDSGEVLCDVRRLQNIAMKGDPICALLDAAVHQVNDVRQFRSFLSGLTDCSAAREPNPQQQKVSVSFENYSN